VHESFDRTFSVALNIVTTRAFGDEVVLAPQRAHCQLEALAMLWMAGESSNEAFGAASNHASRR
jgi:hypothetical protein